MKKERKFNYIIGDIHGCYQELILLEEKIKKHSEKNNANPIIYSVGDLVDRGQDSKKVIDHFMDGEKNGTHQVVIGNHEILMLETIEALAPKNFRRTGSKFPVWLRKLKDKHKENKAHPRDTKWEDYSIYRKCHWIGQGGYATLKSFGIDPHDVATWNIPKKYIEFILKMPLKIETKDFIITHALGEDQDLKVAKKHMHKDLKVKDNKKEIEDVRKAVFNITWNRKSKRLASKKVHISGHTSFQNPKKSKLNNRIQIDTACVYGGKLTAWCSETNTFLSIDALKKHY